MAEDARFVTYQSDTRPILAGPAQMQNHKQYLALKEQAKREGRRIQYVNSEQEYAALTGEQQPEAPRTAAGVHTDGARKIYTVLSSVIGNSARTYAAHKLRAKELGLAFRVIDDTLGPGAA